MDSICPFGLGRIAGMIKSLEIRPVLAPFALAKYCRGWKRDCRTQQQHPTTRPFCALRPLGQFRRHHGRPRRSSTRNPAYIRGPTRSFVLPFSASNPLSKDKSGKSQSTQSNLVKHSKTKKSGKRNHKRCTHLLVYVEHTRGTRRLSWLQGRRFFPVLLQSPERE